MCLKLYEDAIRVKAKKKKARRKSRGSPTPQDEPTDADAAEPPGVNGGGDIASMVEAMSQASPSEAGSSSRKHSKSSTPSVASIASHGTKGDVDPLMSRLHQQPKPELKWFKRV